MCRRWSGRTLSHQPDLDEEMIPMIDWGSEDWGGGVHHATNGSWVTDTHGADAGTADQ